MKEEEEDDDDDDGDDNNNDDDEPMQTYQFSKSMPSSPSHGLLSPFKDA